MGFENVEKILEEIIAKISKNSKLNTDEKMVVMKWLVDVSADGILREEQLIKLNKAIEKEPGVIVLVYNLLNDVYETFRNKGTREHHELVKELKNTLN